MKRLVLMAILAICLTACAAHGPKSMRKEPEIKETNKVKVKRIGVQFDKNTFKPVVSKTLTDGPAAKAGIQYGDIISKINGIAVTDKISVSDLLDSIDNKGLPVDVEVIRNELPIILKITPTESELSPTFIKITKLVMSGVKVHLAVIAGDVSNSYNFKTIFDRDEWKKNITKNILADIEKGSIAAFNEYTNFMLIDRYNLEKILKELNLTETKYISENQRAEIGKFTGATYILFSEFARGKYDNKHYVDEKYRRLINIETGKVEAIDTEKYVFDND